MTALDAAAADPWQIIADLQRKLDVSTAELSEAKERETATAEVLQVINSSPGDLAPVFDAMLEKAMRLCDATFGLMRVADGAHFRTVGARGVPAAYAEYLIRNPEPAGEGGIAARNRDGEPFVHTIDLKDDERYRRGVPTRRAMVDLGGARTSLSMALRKDRDVLGAIHIYREEVRPFTDKQIALLQNFAAQAVIAMENARLINETREALEQQTATAEVLQVINSSPGDLAPVFEALLEKAMRLCDAAFGALATFDGSTLRTAATRGVPPEYARFRMNNPPVYGPKTAPGRFIAGERLIHNIDLKAEDAYRERDPNRRALVDIGGARTALQVALRKDDALLGSMTIYRQEVRPFTDKQIALLQNFAAQAVIAMENARLLTETREALEQQTATAEVLQVINSSPGELAPVFEAMLEKATRLCDAAFGQLYTYEGETFAPAAVNGEAHFIEWLRQRGLWKPLADGRSPMARVVRGEPIVHIADVLNDEAYREANSSFQQHVDSSGMRSLLTVALRKDDALLGAITIYRREVRPFSDKQIALLQNFAAQAVIAIENARLITETREALEQQTATAEVLQVINSSPGDLAPVFDAILEKAHTLCRASFGGLMAIEGDQYRAVAARGPAELADYWRSLDWIQFPTGPNSLFTILSRGELIHVADAANDHSRETSESYRRLVELGHARTLLMVPLRTDETLLGAITAFRDEVRLFSDKEVALLQNFAAQAVIAMENARLITETHEALEQQTATAEILQVINSSPGDLVPVFDAMLEKAMRLCEAAFGLLSNYDGEQFHSVAQHGVPEEFVQRYLREPFRTAPNTTHDRLIRGEHLVHVTDLAAEGIDDPRRRAVVEVMGARTILGVALRKDGTLLGAIHIYRKEVHPFSDKQIALLQNFAAQAVIAMENARLITETREALEQQTATAEVLQVINGSPGDLAPVFDAMLEKSMRLCESGFGQLLTYDGVRFHIVAIRGVPEAFAAYSRNLATRPRAGSFGDRVLEGHRVVHILDLKNEEIYEAGDPNRRAIVDLGGARTALIAALRKDDAVLGFIILFRQEVRPFTDKQVALLENFAAQAVIAMENARLLDEIHQRQAELRVTFDNMADGVAMFDEDLRLTAWNRHFQELLDLPDAVLAERPRYADYLRILADRGEFGTEDIEGELSRRLEHTDQELRLERTRPDGRVIEVRRNAVQDGGFVLIYSDITERKRSEAEIRAARDAAEAAYRDLKAAQANLIQAEKMASLGQLTAGIAHEIKNPLNFVNNFADLSVELLDELKETTAPAVAALGKDKRAEVDETIGMLTGNLEKIAEHGRRADGIVKSMLEHSRGSSGERRSVDLNGLIEEALNLAYHGARAQDASFNVTLERDFAHGITPIELVPQNITRVCLNLIGNGFYAATKRQKEGSDPKFKPTLKVSTRDLGDTVEVQVRDNGTGIAPEIKDKLFQPFFTTKPTGEGTGLGLSISYDIVTQEHGGTITVDSQVGEFTEFTVRLPRAYGATMTEAAS